MKNHKAVGNPLDWISVVLFSIAIVFLPLMGCSVSFTQNEVLQFSLSEPTDKAMSIVAEFEAGEGDNAAGDVTQKAGSVCVGGACIIY